MIETLYQEMAQQANQLADWIVALVVAVLAYVTYKYRWLGIFIVSVGLFGWVFYTVLTFHDLNKEKEAVGFLVVFLLVGVFVNGVLLYKAVNDS